MNRGPSPSAAGFLETVVVWHLAVFMVGAAWAFGGNADWVRTPISVWGSMGLVLTVLAASLPGRGGVARGALHWMWPILLLNGLVLASCMTPGFKIVAAGSSPLMVPLAQPWWRPSAAHADLAIRALWLFDGIYFSCLNVALTVTRRRVLRFLLMVAVVNATALSIFGTVQKLVGSTGIYFNSVRTPQPLFFASFVYDNHWGAFAVLSIGACVGLGIRYARGTERQGFFHGPAAAIMVATLLVGLSVPFSGSRACTLLVLAIGAASVAKGVPALSRALHMSGVTPLASFLGMAAAAVVAGAAVWLVAGDVIHSRAERTKEQLAAMWANGGIGSRGELYRDTWRMARDRPAFGWGMGSYPSVFRIYNTQISRIDRIPVVYHDAHSDWLQSAAELGLAGTLLLGLCAALPLVSVRSRRLSAIPFFLLAGCALVALYAWIEFPFGNVSVVLLWWFCFFVAIQYLRLSAGPAAPDES